MKKVIGFSFCILWVFFSCSSLTEKEKAAKKLVRDYLESCKTDSSKIKEFYPYAYYLRAKTKKISEYTIDSVITINSNDISVYVNTNNQYSNIIFHVGIDSLSDEIKEFEADNPGTSLYLSDSTDIQQLYVMSVEDSINYVVNNKKDSLINKFSPKIIHNLKILDSENYFEFNNELHQVSLNTFPEIQTSHDVFKQKYIRACAMYARQIGMSIHRGEIQLFKYSWGGS